MNTRLGWGIALAAFAALSASSASAEDAVVTASAPTAEAVAMTAPPTSLVAPDSKISVGVGSFSIAPDGTVSGTLPYGTSLSDPPSDPADPTMRAKILRGKKSGLRVLERSDLAPLGSTQTAVAARVSKNKAKRSVYLENKKGCVRMQGSGDAYGYFTYHGYMQLCAAGNLWCHEYRNVNFGNGWDYIEDTPPNTGANGQCGLPSIDFHSSNYQFAQNAWEIFYCHGKNKTTGGDDTTYIEFVK